MKRTLSTWMLVTICAISVSLMALRPLRAQQDTELAQSQISRNDASVDFPDQITFRLEWNLDSPIVEATLTYDVVQSSCLEAAAHVPVEVGDAAAEWTWIMVRSGNPPPGSIVWWEWHLTDAEGNSFVTPRQEIVVEDNRFEWRTVETGAIHLHWYRGDEVGPILLDAATIGLQRLQDEMGIQLQDDVHFFIYGSSEEMREAVLYIQDWAGGVAFGEHSTILIGVPPSIAETWGRKTVQHELAHLVIGQFGWSCLGGSRPTWLNEGLAVIAEGELQEDFAEALREALETNSFEPIRSLNGAFPADEKGAGLAYAQSYSVVNFLLTSYGQEKMQQLLLVLAEGKGYDEALQEAYGFNVDGLEQAWRQAIGAAERDIPPTPTPISAASIPTIVPQGRPRSLPTPPSAAEPPPEAATQGPGLCGLGLLPVFLIGLANRRSADRKART